MGGEKRRSGAGGTEPQRTFDNAGSQITNDFHITRGSKVFFVPSTTPEPSSTLIKIVLQSYQQHEKEWSDTHMRAEFRLVVSNMLAVTAPPFFWLETEKRYQRGHVPRKTHPKHDPSFKLSTTTPSLSLDEL